MKFAPRDSQDMTILLDTNVILDILLNRKPWQEGEFPGAFVVLILFKYWHKLGTYGG